MKAYKLVSFEGNKFKCRKIDTWKWIGSPIDEIETISFIDGPKYKISFLGVFNSMFVVGDPDKFALKYGTCSSIPGAHFIIFKEYFKVKNHIMLI